jgi:hypothetical protein
MWLWEAHVAAPTSNMLHPWTSRIFVHAACNDDAPPTPVWPAPRCLICSTGDLAQTNCVCAPCAHTIWQQWVAKAMLSTTPVAVPAACMAQPPAATCLLLPGGLPLRFLQRYMAEDVVRVEQAALAASPLVYTSRSLDVPGLEHRAAAVVQSIVDQNHRFMCATAVREAIEAAGLVWDDNRAYVDGVLGALAQPRQTTGRFHTSARRAPAYPALQLLSTAANRARVQCYTGCMATIQTGRYACALCLLTSSPLPPHDPALRARLLRPLRTMADVGDPAKLALPTFDDVRSALLRAARPDTVEMVVAIMLAERACFVSLAHVPTCPPVPVSAKILSPDDLAELVAANVLLRYAYPAPIFALNLPHVLLALGFYPLMKFATVPSADQSAYYPTFPPQHEGQLVPIE